MRIAGIDPGWSGGIATLDGRGHPCTVAAFNKMTEKDIIRAILLGCDGVDACYIEKVHAMPKQGVSSTFKFGHNYGLLRAIILSLDSFPIYEVTPQKWQKRLSCRTKGDKNVTKSLAQQWFLGVKVTHGNADALLIAEYGRLVYTEEHPVTELS